MLSEPTQTPADVKSEISMVQTANSSSHLRVPSIEVTTSGNMAESERRGSTSSDTTLSEQLSLFSSATSIDSSTSYGSSISNDSGLIKSSQTAPEVSYPTTGSLSRRPTQRFTKDMFILRSACRYDCHCACHEKPTEEPQRRFSRSRHQKITCTDLNCLGTVSNSNISKQYSSLFSLALSKVTSEKTIRVPYDLKTFRTVPNASNAVRHINHGNLVKLKDCIESGEATIWDTTLDGWSLLHVSSFKNSQPKEGREGLLC